MKFLLCRCPLVWTVGRNQKDKWEIIQKKPRVASSSSPYGHHHLVYERKWRVLHSASLEGGKRGTATEGNRRVRPKVKCVQEVHMHVQFSLRPGTSTLSFFAMAGCYNSKHQNQAGPFTAHCSTSLLPRTSLRPRGSGLNS